MHSFLVFLEILYDFDFRRCLGSKLCHFFLANGIIKNARVNEALRSVDRAHFIRQNPYTDSPQGIGYAVTISAPHMVCLQF